MRRDVVYSCASDLLLRRLDFPRLKRWEPQCIVVSVAMNEASEKEAIPERTMTENNCGNQYWDVRIGMVFKCKDRLPAWDTRIDGLSHKSSKEVEKTRRALTYKAPSIASRTLLRLQRPCLCTNRPCPKTIQQTDFWRSTHGVYCELNQLVSVGKQAGKKYEAYTKKRKRYA